MAADTALAPLTRGHRKRERTRSQLIAAGLRVLAEKGEDLRSVLPVKVTPTITMASLNTDRSRAACKSLMTALPANQRDVPANCAAMITKRMRRGRVGVSEEGESISPTK